MNREVKMLRQYWKIALLVLVIAGVLICLEICGILMGMNGI